MTATAPPRAELAYGALQLDRADDAGPVEFVASTERVNRYNFRLNPDHWLLDNYRANPVVVLQHRADELPIGRAEVQLDRFARQLRAAVTFDRADPRAAEVEGKVRRGFVRAMSAGWGFVDRAGAAIADWWRLSAQQVYEDTWYDLAELSIVTVPGDPGAVRAEQALASGVTADGAASLLGALRLDPDPVTAAVRQVLGEALAARAARRGSVLDAFPTPGYLAPIVGGRR
jgi:hypothetical protein